MALVEEIITRWDETEFTLAKQSIKPLAAQSADPNSIASNTFKILWFMVRRIFFPKIQLVQSTPSKITLDDLTCLMRKYKSKRGRTLWWLVQPINKSRKWGASKGSWEVAEVQIPEFVKPEPITEPIVYFYDVPGAKQSVLNYFGY